MKERSSDATPIEVSQAKRSTATSGAP
jgi:hypothetical protein